MYRADIEKTVRPIILECLRKFGDYSRPGVPVEEFAAVVNSELRPDVRRVSLLISLLQSVGCEPCGEALELGCGYGFLLFPMALFNPKLHWTAVEHPDRSFFSREDFQQVLRDYKCELAGVDFVHQRLPFADESFSVVTLSETLEHLPIEGVNFVFDEVTRVLRPGGILVASSPNQASLENRIRLLKGKSIFDLPKYLAVAKGIYGHIRLYTPAEMCQLMSERGFVLERSVLESNNSAFRGNSPHSLYRTWYRLYENAEQHLEFLRNFGDTWYMVFRKNSCQPS